jgi:hypothetical protein
MKAEGTALLLKLGICQALGKFGCYPSSQSDEWLGFDVVMWNFSMSDSIDFKSGLLGSSARA